MRNVSAPVWDRKFGFHEIINAHAASKYLICGVVHFYPDLSLMELISRKCTKSIQESNLSWYFEKKSTLKKEVITLSQFQSVTYSISIQKLRVHQNSTDFVFYWNWSKIFPTFHGSFRIIGTVNSLTNCFHTNYFNHKMTVLLSLNFACYKCR